MLASEGVELILSLPLSFGRMDNLTKGLLPHEGRDRSFTIVLFDKKRLSFAPH